MKKNLGRDSDARLLWQDEINPRVRCAFGNVFANVDRVLQCFEGQLTKRGVDRNNKD